MCDLLRASGNWLLVASLVMLTAVPTGALAAPSTQPASGVDIYGAAVGNARYVPEGYRPAAQRLQFVVFGDRTGSEQPGFLKQGIDLVNLLRPEFVLSIGDLIEGYVKPGNGLTTEQVMFKTRDQWTEFDAMVRQLRMPYFYLAGNHDIWDAASATFYTNLHGPRYYSFDAKNVHVIVLSSEEYQEVGGNGMLGEAQIAWLRKDLEASKDAALTVVALHHPVWRNPKRNDWPAVEGLLAGRNTIVFAGHEHTYSCETRNGIPYVIVGPVAGIQQEEKSDARGLFRHVTLVTVEDSSPHVALVKLDAVLPMDIASPTGRERLDSVWKSSRLDYSLTEPSADKPVSFVWSLSNPLDVPVKIDAAWPKGSAWQIEPATASVTLPPKEAKQVEFRGQQRLKTTGQPTMRAEISWPGTDGKPVQLDWPAQPLRMLEVGRVYGIRLTGPVEEGWARLPQAALTDAAQCTSGLAYWSGSQDLSGRVQASLDGPALCLLVQVGDDDIQIAGDQVEIIFAAAPLATVVDSNAESFYKLTATAPDEKNSNSIRWNSKGRLEFSATARRVSGGWVSKIVLDITPLVEGIEGDLRLPLTYVVKDADKGQPTPTTFTWSGNREATYTSRQWGVLVISADRVKAAQQAIKVAAGTADTVTR